MSGAVSVHIDELVMIGVRPGDRDRVVQALQAELTRLLRVSPPRAAGIRGKPVSIERLAAPAAKLSVAPSPRSVGRLAAAQIHSGLKEAW
jgi:hypothetical protein